MINIDSINDMARQFSAKLPPETKKFKKELDKNFRAVLQSVFSKLELVTREEFNVQKGVLAKTRAKLNILEKTITELEKHSPKTKVKKKGK